MLVGIPGAGASAGGDLKLISLLTEPSSSMTVRVWTWMFPPEVVNVVKLVLHGFPGLVSNPILLTTRDLYLRSYF